jgi:hypothetical protein
MKFNQNKNKLVTLLNGTYQQTFLFLKNQEEVFHQTQNNHNLIEGNKN